MRAKVALVGCGNPAQKWHLPTLAELTRRGELEFVALCDLDGDLAKQTGLHYGVPHYTDIDAMLDAHPEVLAVDIVTGDPTHHLLACHIAERGKHVMVEKPMALTLACCDKVIETCNRHDVHFEIAENYFRMPKQRMILKLIEAGVLGDVVRVYFNEPKRQLPFEPSVSPVGLSRPVHGFGNSSGMCMDMGSHRLSQLRLYAGREPKRISASVKKYRSDSSFVHEDWAHAMIEFEDGVMGIYETSRLGETQKFCQITGSLGGIFDVDTFGPDLPLRVCVGAAWEDIAVETVRSRIGGIDVVQRIVAHTNPPIVVENPFAHCAIDDWSVGHASEIMSLANAALNDEPPEYGIEGRKDVEMAMAIYESSLNDMATIELPLTQQTGFEAALHADYLEKFGVPIV